MKIVEFDSLIAKREGKKKQTSIGNVRETRARVFEALGEISIADFKRWGKKYCWPI